MTPLSLFVPGGFPAGHSLRTVINYKEKPVGCQAYAAVGGQAQEGEGTGYELIRVLTVSLEVDRGAEDNLRQPVFSRPAPFSI